MDRKQRYDEKRRAEKPWRKWYGTPRWKQLRAAVLANEPVCRLCKKARSQVCDHVSLHNGDPIKFWNGPFQALCKRCHDGTKQALEAIGRNQAETVLDANGWPIATSRPEGWVSRDELFLPPDLKPSRPRLTIIAGPPGAGKSTYMDQHAQPGDLRIDSDLEADRLGINRYTENWADRVRLLKARNDRLRELHTSNADRAWFTALLGKPEHRAHFTKLLQPAEVIVILTPAEICIERIEKTRQAHTGVMRRSVARWFQQYVPRPNETAIRISGPI